MQVRPTKAPPARPAKSATEPARTLAQEKADFTAEGSPPPGQVAGTAPVVAAGDAVALSPDAAAKGAAAGRRQPPQPAGPVRRASKRHGAAWRGNG